MSSNGHAPDGPDRAIILSGPSNSKDEDITKECRILTVEQAIPYSPFSSIVPFDSGPFKILFPCPLSACDPPTQYLKGRTRLKRVGMDWKT